MPLKNIKQILKESMGLHADSIGDSSVQRAVEHRMAAVSVSNMGKYLELVLADNVELLELIEEVIVPETWFFRNINAFTALKSKVLELLGNGGATPLRLLSIPCSTGEEAYSIAMMLLDVGLTERDFHVDAVDISHRSLKKAKRGIYGKHSFREEGVMEYWQGKYFSHLASGFKINDEVKACVTFRQGNILAQELGLLVTAYDVIFCRNLLIYFDREMQRQVLDKLYDALKDKGVLFIGHGETSQIHAAKWHKIQPARSFAYAKEQGSKEAVYGKDILKLLSDAYSKLEATVKASAVTAPVVDKGKSQTFSAIPENVAPPVSAPAVAISSISEIEALIQKGQLEDAEALCQAYITTHPESAEAHYFQGLAHYMMDRIPSAEENLKKTLYLDPDNYRALGLLALLSEKKGDLQAADTYRRREARVLKRKPHVKDSNG